MSIKTKLGQLGAAVGSSFTPRSNLPRSDVQSAVEYVMDNAENVGTVYAPTDAQYLTSASESGLSNERVVANGTGITWDFTGVGAAVANFDFLGIEDLADPGGDRGMFWDVTAGAVTFFTPASGLEFVGTNLSITDPDLTAIINEASFAAGDILYHNGTTLARLPAGTDGQFFRTRGTAAAPDWQNISGGGDMLRANNLSDLANASTARDNLGVEIGADVQAYDAGLQSISGLTTAANKMIYTTASDTYAVADLSVFARTFLDDANGTAVLATLGATIGTNVQAWDAQLDSLSSASANGVSLVTAADYAAMRALLDLEVGTDFLSPAAIAAAYQPLDGELTALAGTTSAADTLPYFTGLGTATTTTLTGFARAILDDINEATFKATVNLEIGVDVQAYSSILQNTTASFLTSQETKLGFITVTQAVDLDAIESRVNDLDAAVVLKGGWDASAGTFPGGGVAQSGWSYIVTVAGTVDGVAFSINDRLLAYLDNASTTTYASNWIKLDYTDQVLSVAGRTGAVTISSTDITDSTSNSRSMLTAADYAAMRSLLGLVIGTNVQAYDAELAALSGLTSAADAAPYFTGSGTAALMTVTSFGRSIIDDADEATFKATVNLEIGTDVQAYDADLGALATNSTNGIWARTGAGTGAARTITQSTGITVTNGDGVSGNPTIAASTGVLTAELIFIIDGGGSVITTGVKGFIEIPFACTINSATALADQSGSIVVDVWKDTYANYPPVDADSITASAPVTISSATKSQDSTLTGWTTSISAGDVLGFNVDSITTCQRVTIALKVTKT